MIVMPANKSGGLWHSLARETGRLGHLYSPRAQRGPWPWFPYALDNGAYSCWDVRANAFDDGKWRAVETDWHRLIVWSQCARIKPRWAIVPDVPGDMESTFRRWEHFAPALTSCPRALAVQDGMEAGDVRALSVQPDVICVGGTTEWKWRTVGLWAVPAPLAFSVIGHLLWLLVRIRSRPVPRPAR